MGASQEALRKLKVFLAASGAWLFGTEILVALLLPSPVGYRWPKTSPHCRKSRQAGLLIEKTHQVPYMIDLAEPWVEIAAFQGAAAARSHGLYQIEVQLLTVHTQVSTQVIIRSYGHCAAQVGVQFFVNCSHYRRVDFTAWK